METRVSSSDTGAQVFIYLILVDKLVILYLIFILKVVPKLDGWI
jgi:hypothetical protein